MNAKKSIVINLSGVYVNGSRRRVLHRDTSRRLNNDRISTGSALHRLSFQASDVSAAVGAYALHKLPRHPPSEDEHGDYRDDGEEGEEDEE